MMKLSALQIGFGVSVLTHGLVFSVAPLLAIGHRGARSDIATGESARLEILLVTEQGEPPHSTAVADVPRPISAAAAQAPAVADTPAVEPEPAQLQPEDIDRPTEVALPEEQNASQVAHPTEDLSASEQSSPVPASAGQDTAAPTPATGSLVSVS